MKPIAEIAQAMGLSDDDVDLYRKYKAKISLNVLNKFADKPNGKYVVVTAITPRRTVKARRRRPSAWRWR